MKLLCPRCGGPKLSEFRRTTWVTAVQVRIWQCVKCGYEVYYGESRFMKVCDYLRDPLIIMVSCCVAVTIGIVLLAI